MNKHAPSYLKDLIVPYHPNRALQAYLLFLGYLKVKCETEPSYFRPLFSGASSQFGNRETTSTFKIILKTLNFYKAHL